jgi:light-regulated signal transduction histidine kinase (bacteriophytochrome)
MSTTHETSEITEPAIEISAYPPSEIRFIEDMKKSVSQYKLSVENNQKDWVQSCKNYFELVESVQREFAEKSETTVTMIDATTRIVKALVENAKAFAELNQTITQLWMNPWSTERK